MKFETKIQDMIVRTHNVRSFRFHRPSSLDYKAGQFLFATIKRGETKLKKQFTISSSPSERGFIEFTKKLTESDFSETLRIMKTGDWAEIDAPYGSFTFQGEYDKIAMLSGGIGITPFRSMCRYCTDMHLESNIILLYGNETEDDIVFRTEFEGMQRQNENLKVIFTLIEPNSSWKGLTGRINADMIKSQIRDYQERVFYLCGPPEMVDAMASLLEELKVPEDRIKRENFRGY